MPKLKITQKQYNAILLHEHETRLNEARAMLNGKGNPEADLLEEGRLENAVMAVAMMLGVGLTGNNKAMAQKVVKDPIKTKEVVAQLKNPQDLSKIFDILKDKTLKNPEQAVAKAIEKNKINTDKILKDLEDEDTKITTREFTNLKQMQLALAQGFALVDFDVDIDTVKAHQSPHVVAFQDTLSVKFEGNNLFGTSKSTMSKEGLDAINKVFEEIKKNGGKIISIGVQSSTDAEHFYINGKNTKNPESDKTGNITLANLRYHSVSDYVSTLVGSDVPVTSIDGKGAIPNQGGLEQGTTEADFKKAANDTDPTKLDDLRDETAKYRYVKLDIKAVYIIKDTVQTEVPEKIVKTVQGKMVQSLVSHGVKGGGPKGDHFKHKEFKCPKVKIGKINVAKCSFQK